MILFNCLVIIDCEAFNFFPYKSKNLFESFKTNIPRKTVNIASNTSF